MDLRPSSSEAGLNLVLPDGLPMRRQAVWNIDMQQDESTDVIKRPEHASAVGRIRVHSDRFKNKLGQ
jgi:hypothetical protein